MSESLTITKWISQEEASKHVQAPIGLSLGGFFNPPAEFPKGEVVPPGFFGEAWWYTKVLALAIVISGSAVIYLLGQVHSALIIPPIIGGTGIVILLLRKEKRIVNQQELFLQELRRHIESLYVIVQDRLAVMRWKDYIDSVPEAGRPYAEILRKEVADKSIRDGGLWHHSSTGGFPVFSDGRVAGFTLKGWGDFMAAVWSEEEGRGYSYVHFQRQGCPHLGAASPWSRGIE